MLYPYITNKKFNYGTPFIFLITLPGTLTASAQDLSAKDSSQILSVISEWDQAWATLHTKVLIPEALYSILNSFGVQFFFFLNILLKFDMLLKPHR